MQTRHCVCVCVCTVVVVNVAVERLRGHARCFTLLAPRLLPKPMSRHLLSLLLLPLLSLLFLLTVGVGPRSFLFIYSFTFCFFVGAHSLCGYSWTLYGVGCLDFFSFFSQKKIIISYEIIFVLRIITLGNCRLFISFFRYKKTNEFLLSWKYKTDHCWFVI